MSSTPIHSVAIPRTNLMWKIERRMDMRRLNQLFRSNKFGNNVPKMEHLILMREKHTKVLLNKVLQMDCESITEFTTKECFQEIKKYFQMCCMDRKIVHVSLKQESNNETKDEFFIFPCVFAASNGELLYMVVRKLTDKKTKNRYEYNWRFNHYCTKSEICDHLTAASIKQVRSNYDSKYTNDWKNSFLLGLPARGVTVNKEEKLKTNYPFVFDGFDSLLNSKIIYSALRLNCNDRNFNPDAIQKYYRKMQREMKIDCHTLKELVKQAVHDTIDKLQGGDGGDVGDGIIYAQIRILDRKFLRERVCYAEVVYENKVYYTPFCLEENKSQRCYYIGQLLTPWMVKCNVGLNYPQKLFNSLSNFKQFYYDEENKKFWPFIINDIKVIYPNECYSLYKLGLKMPMMNQITSYNNYGNGSNGGNGGCGVNNVPFKPHPQTGVGGVAGVAGVAGVQSQTQYRPHCQVQVQPQPQQLQQQQQRQQQQQQVPMAPAGQQQQYQQQQYQQQQQQQQQHTVANVNSVQFSQTPAPAFTQALTQTPINFVQQFLVIPIAPLQQQQQVPTILPGNVNYISNTPNIQQIQNINVQNSNVQNLNNLQGAMNVNNANTFTTLNAFNNMNGMNNMKNVNVNNVGSTNGKGISSSVSNINNIGNIGRSSTSLRNDGSMMTSTRLSVGGGKTWQQLAQMSNIGQTSAASATTTQVAQMHDKAMASMTSGPSTTPSTSKNDKSSIPIAWGRDRVFHSISRQAVFNPLGAVNGISMDCKQDKNLTNFGALNTIISSYSSGIGNGNGSGIGIGIGGNVMQNVNVNVNVNARKRENSVVIEDKRVGLRSDVGERSQSGEILVYYNEKKGEFAEGTYDWLIDMGKIVVAFCKEKNFRVQQYQREFNLLLGIHKKALDKCAGLVDQWLTLKQENIDSLDKISQFWHGRVWETQQVYETGKLNGNAPRKLKC